MIFVGIVTCDRPDFFEKCYKSVKLANNVNIIAVCNDGRNDVSVEPNTIYIKHQKNKGVSCSKNDLFKEALKIRDVEHIFIIEDDIIVKNSNVFNEYIKAKQITGIHHFMFGYHGPANKGNISGGPPRPRYVIDYGDNFKLAINAHSVGAFCYYSRESLEKTGLFDESFINAFDHVDHDYRLAKNGYSTPYWNWADLADSINFLEELECSETNSSIRGKKNWMENIKNGAKKFYEKHGFMPAWQNHVPDTTKSELISILKKLKNEN